MATTKKKKQKLKRNNKAQEQLYATFVAENLELNQSLFMNLNVWKNGKFKILNFQRSKDAHCQKSHKGLEECQGNQIY